MLATPIFGSDTLPSVLSLMTAVADPAITAREVSRRLGTNLESTQRAMQRLADAGLLHPNRHGRELRYVIDRSDSESFQDLRAVSHRLAGMGADLATRAKKLPKNAIQQAFLFGSMASGSDRPASDVDVFVIGSAHTHDLSDFTWTWSQRLNRDVVPVIHTREAVEAGIANEASFYRNVLTGPILMLVGSAADLPRAA